MATYKTESFASPVKRSGATVLRKFRLNLLSTEKRVNIRTSSLFGLSRNTILTMRFGSVPFIHLQFSNDLLYRNTYKYSSDTRFLKGVPRMSNNMFVLRSLNKTRQNISMKRLNVPELSVSELVPINSEKSTHKYLRTTSLFLKVFSSRKLIRFPENKLEGEKYHDCQLMSAQFSWDLLLSFSEGVLL